MNILSEGPTRTKTGGPKTFFERCEDSDPKGRELQTRLAAFVKAPGLEVVYLVCPLTYNVEHLLPLLCAMRGRLVHNKDKPPVPELRSALKEYGILQELETMAPKDLETLVKDGRHILISVTGNITPWCKMQPGSSTGEGRQVYQNAVYLTHGIDEDLVWHTPGVESGPRFAQI